MGEQTWTKEPWEDVMGTWYSQPYVHKLSQVDWDRARACVNALAGIDDPAAYRKNVERLAEAAIAAKPYVLTTGYSLSRANDLNNAIAALATTTSKPKSD